MKLAPALVLALVLPACGGKSHEVCPSEKHPADPDGHGERCVDDRSTCEAPDDCATADACCTATCEDAGGDGVYACGQSCRAPDCTEGSCGDGWRCQGAPGDACTAYCVPDDVDCPDGTVPADPSGSGIFECIASGSGCFRPADCPGSADGCCAGYCREAADDVWSCELDCGAAGGFDDSDGEAVWQCTTDLDCEAMMGGPGWTCEEYACGGGNECVPPVPECYVDDDCVLATDVTQCCPTCAAAYSLGEVADNPCLAPQDGDQGGAEPPGDPAVCAPVICSDEDCPLVLCEPPDAAGCSEGQCVPIYL